MQKFIAVFGVFICGLIGVQAHAQGFPTSCGDTSVQFDVKTAATQPTAPLPPPADGQSKIVLIGDEIFTTNVLTHPTIRFGVDGAWVGASQKNSYFTADITPGEHHLCANWQSSLSGLRQYAGFTSLDAQPGKTYYFIAKLREVYTGTKGIDVYDLSLQQVSQDEGSWHMNLSKFATPTAKK